MTAKVIQINEPLTQEQRSLVLSSRYVEFVGGIGDIIMRCHHSDRYQALDGDGSGRPVAVGIFSHNPHAKEMFLWHPNADRITILDAGWNVRRWANPAWRELRGFPESDESNGAHLDRIEYHTSEEDNLILAALKKAGKYIVFSTSGSSDFRNIPAPLCETMARMVQEAGFYVVIVGRDYNKDRVMLDEKIYRKEPRFNITGHHMNLINALSVPGVAKAVEGASGTIVSHSSVCVMSWFANRPTFMLTDHNTMKIHLWIGYKGFMFGAPRRGNDHMVYEAWSERRFKTFLEGIK